MEATEVEKRQESKAVQNIGFHSTDSEELTNISQLSQREEKEISHKPGISSSVQVVHISYRFSYFIEISNWISLNLCPNWSEWGHVDHNLEILLIS